MSGVEVAGLVLAVIPLVIAALEAHKQGRNPIRTFSGRWTFELESLVRCLKEQRWFFRNSVQILLQAAGEGEDLTLGADPVVLLLKPEIRQQVQSYLTDSETLDFFDGVVDGYRTSLEAVLQRLGHIHKVSSAPNSLAAVLTINVPNDGAFHFSKRFEFTMKHREMRRQIESLDLCNDKLQKLVNRIGSVNTTKRKDLTKEQAAKELASALQQVRHHAIVLHTAFDTRWSAGCEPVHPSLLVLDCRLSMAVSTRATQHVVFHSVLACGQSVTNLHDKCQETFVLAEQAVGPSNRQELSNLCQHLAQVTIAGKTIAIDMDSSSKLYSSPTNHTAHFDPAKVQGTINLEQLLRGNVRLTPRQRTQLAVDIACSLLQLQTTPWYGSTWTSQTIRFFQQAINTRQVPYCAKPFIERAFPGGGPIHQNDSVKADMLELGILLLEVWNLQAFDSWTSQNGIILESGYYARMKAAIQWLEAESDMMTPSYVDAVSVCVRFSFEGVQHSWEHPAFRRAVCEKVLGSLRENHKAWVRS